MTRWILVLITAAMLTQAQRRGREDPDRPDRSERDLRLPNGKMQQEEILKAEHEKSLQEVAQLIKVANELQDDMVKNDHNVLSLASLKKAEEIEKLARRIRSRMKK